MAISDLEVIRIYSCTNAECAGQLSMKQKASEKWRKKCPFCKKFSLVLDSASLTISTFIDTKKPKTLGSMSQENRKRKEKEFGPEVDTKPFWRKSKKIDFNILKNPRKYVQSGDK